MNTYLVVLNTIHGNKRVTTRADNERTAIAQAVCAYSTTVLLRMEMPSDLDLTDASGLGAVEQMGISVGAVETI